MIFLKSIALIFIGLASGIVIAGGVFAFIAIIGVIPRLAQKTDTQNKLTLYEDSITAGGLFGVVMINFSLPFNIGVIGAIIYGLCAGTFVGCLAVSLAEVLDVIPILTKRIRIQVGMCYFMIALALGKLTASLIYWIVPGFFKYKN